MKYLLPVDQNETVMLSLRKEERRQMHVAYLAYPEAMHCLADGV